MKIIDYLLEDESLVEMRVETFKENLGLVFNIVSSDERRRLNFSDEIYREINRGMPYEMKVLKILR